MLSWLGVYPFRCEVCAARFLRIAPGGRASARVAENGG
jgi:hypothetical protein